MVEWKLVDINLHTDVRIRFVCTFAHLGFASFGRRLLYGGSLDYGIEGQALHCHRLAFYRSFSPKKRWSMHLPLLTDDFETVITNLQTKKID